MTLIEHISRSLKRNKDFTKASDFHKHEKRRCQQTGHMTLTKSFYADANKNEN